MSNVLTHAGRPFRVLARGAEPRTGAGLGDLVWLTWRQHRWTITASLTVAAVLTSWMSYLAAHIASINQQCGNTVCDPGTAQFVDLNASFGPLQISGLLTDLVVFLPLLIGMFLGVPLLAREHEQRTLLLAWSQDVTPARWLWTKFGLLSAYTAALMACVSAACGHLADVLNVATAGSLFTGNAFLVTGMLPLVLGVASLAVGVAVGAAIRRVLPAVLTTIGEFIGLYLLVQWRYPTFMTPVKAAVPMGGGKTLFTLGSLGANSLVVSGIEITPDGNNLVDASGHAVSPASLEAMCPAPALSSGGSGKGENFATCMAQHHLSGLVTYQPGNRIADFHLILICGYLGIGLLAVAATWWLVRRTSLSAG